MASNTKLDRAIERCEKAQILYSVNDHGGTYESYTCILINGERETNIYLGIDHLSNRITLGRTGLFNEDILATVKGNTKTLDQSVIHSFDGKKLGRLHQNTAVSDISNTAFLECLVSPADASDEATIRDPRTEAVLAYLYASNAFNLSEVITIRYKSKIRLKPVTKISILLLAFKSFKRKASPHITIPPLNYRTLEELASVQSITIFKSSYTKQHNREYSYFKVLEIPTKQHILTIEVFSNGCNNFRMTTSNLNGRTLFWAEPLVNFPRKTKVYGNKTTEIGEIQRYSLLANSPIGTNAELRTHGKKLPTGPDSFHLAYRHLTDQEIAEIIPDGTVCPRQVVMHIHPAVDTTHKALLITYVMKLIFNFYLFYKDVVKQKRHLPQESTDPTLPKKSKPAESTETFSNFPTPVGPPQIPFGSKYVGASSTGESKPFTSTLRPQIQPLSTAFYSGQPLFTAQPSNPDHGQPTAQPLYATPQAHAGQGYEASQSIHTGEGVYGGGRNYLFPAYTPPASAVSYPPNITSSQLPHPSRVAYIPRPVAPPANLVQYPPNITFPQLPPPSRVAYIPRPVAPPASAAPSPSSQLPPPSSVACTTSNRMASLASAIQSQNVSPKSKSAEAPTGNGI